MDPVFSIIIAIIVIIILFSVCGWCCKRKRDGVVYGPGTVPGVHISSQPISSSPVVAPPYPVHQPAVQPQPHLGAPAPGFNTGVTPYPSSMPYQAQGASPYPPTTPYPPAGGGAPYPPAGPPYSAPSIQPPPYDVAVSQPPMHPQPPVHEGYGKQAPYNPHYTGN